MSLISLPMLQVTLQKAAADNPDGIPDSYRPAVDMARSCGACTHFVNNTCTKFSFQADKNYTCDSFSPVQIAQGPLAKLTNPIQPAGPLGPVDPVTSLKITPNQASQLTTEQAFKAGFLLKCKEDGLADSEIYERLQFALRLEKQAILSLLMPVAKGITNTAIIAGIGAPLAAGSLAGYTLAKGNSDIDADVEKIKTEELIDTYDHLADDARQRARIKRKAMGLPEDRELLVLKKDDDDNQLRRDVRSERA